ncbi:hypothetical protein BH20ACT24_BH20ACT24_04360 [soil metagenome]
MSEVGEILELMHTSDLRWRTLRAEGREWRDEAGHLDAFLRRHPQRSSTKVLSFSARDPGVPAGGRRSETSEETWRLWLAPGKVRSEFEAGGETVAVVIRGDTWWSWSPSWGAQTNGGRKNSTHGTGSGEALIAPARILSCANLFVRGRTTVLGRAAFAVRAVPVASDEDDEGPLALHGIGSGDDYELIVDAERGILLRSEARLRDRPVRVLEMRDVSFDEDLPEATFELAPPTRAAFETMMSDRSLLLRGASRCCSLYRLRTTATLSRSGGSVDDPRTVEGAGSPIGSDRLHLVRCITARQLVAPRVRAADAPP